MPFGPGFTVKPSALEALEEFGSSMSKPILEFNEALRRLPSAPIFGAFSEADDLGSVYSTREATLVRAAQITHNLIQQLTEFAESVKLSYLDHEGEVVREAIAAQNIRKATQTIMGYKDGLS
jgi:hypothetical protein